MQDNEKFHLKFNVHAYENIYNTKISAHFLQHRLGESDQIRLFLFPEQCFSYDLSVHLTCCEEMQAYKKGTGKADMDS